MTTKTLEAAAAALLALVDDDYSHAMDDEKAIIDAVRQALEPPSVKTESVWEDDSIQFPRLLAEIRAISLTDHQYGELQESMDLGMAEIDELLERAEVAWQALKEQDRLYLTLRETDQGTPLPDGFFLAGVERLRDLEAQVVLLNAALDSLGYQAVFSAEPAAKDEEVVSYISVDGR